MCKSLEFLIIIIVKIISYLWSNYKVLFSVQSSEELYVVFWILIVTQERSNFYHHFHYADKEIKAQRDEEITQVHTAIKCEAKT